MLGGGERGSGGLELRWSVGGKELVRGAGGYSEVRWFRRLVVVQ